MLKAVSNNQPKVGTVYVIVNYVPGFTLPTDNINQVANGLSCICSFFLLHHLQLGGSDAARLKNRTVVANDNGFSFSYILPALNKDATLIIYLGNNEDVFAYTDKFEEDDPNVVIHKHDGRHLSDEQIRKLLGDHADDLIAMKPYVLEISYGESDAFDKVKSVIMETLAKHKVVTARLV